MSCITKKFHEILLSSLRQTVPVVYLILTEFLNQKDSDSVKSLNQNKIFCK